MNRADFQRLARVRITESRTLLDGGLWEGAYYLAGYAVECALKACIAKKTRRFDFPDKNIVNDSYKHDLKSLVKTAGLETELATASAADPQFASRWSVVEDWSEQSRYETRKTGPQARDLYEAIVSRKNGVLQWLRKHW